MLDYVLFFLFTQKEIKTFNTTGYSVPYHINNLIVNNDIELSQEPDLLILYNLNFNQIIDRIKTTTEWTIIYNDDILELTQIYKSIRSFSHEVFFNDKNFILILHHIKENFIDELNKAHFLPVVNSYIDDFLKIQINQDDSNIKNCQGSTKEQLCQSLLAKEEFIYTGEKITTQDLLKCQMILKSQYKILECKNDTKTVGYFFHNDLKEQVWIYLLSELEPIKNIYQLDKNKMNVPVKIV
jgi:hypothetical protein